jgi:carbamoyl-phosphate synthase large subunit
MNVMFTCAGRRNYLVKAFQEALRGRGQVFAADACAEAPALGWADKSFLLPPLSDASYFDALRTLCLEHSVLLLISLNDFELPVLARHSNRFLEVGTIPVISSPWVVETCFDKWKALQFLKASDLEAPETYLSLSDAREAVVRGNLTFPVVVKPRWGSASIGIAYPNNDQELESDYERTKKSFPWIFLQGIEGTDPEKGVVIQERLCGKEYGLDVVNDLDGHYVCTLVKRKLGMRAGETDRAITVKDSQLEELGRVIGRKLGHIGVLDCDAIVTEGGCYVLDMNPRFGGGYPFSHIAGANLPAALLAWANGERPDPCWLNVEPNITASKYDELLIVDFKPTSGRPSEDPLGSAKQDTQVAGWVCPIG